MNLNPVLYSPYKIEAKISETIQAIKIVYCKVEDKWNPEECVETDWIGDSELEHL